MSIEFLTAKAPAKVSEIAALEARLAAALPEAFRRFLEDRGGGKPIPNQALGESAQPLGVGVNRFFTVEELTERHKDFGQRIPGDLLAIADTEGGNLVCVAVDGDRTGAVYFWDHELEVGEGEPPSEANLTPLAADFERFLECLVPLDVSGTEQPMQVVSAWIDPEFLASLERDD
ncbi:MAG TPA: SMI1/KNR4 family protein [Aeromicrobium sp.]|nr:SMI1/KNR4 family protein [Aeromicrobium sp.]HKY58607.1 SMI1/KNR4 family protein [Aeromicrobium sp.]